jgi:flavin reductase (DIM6/NTAB) family NADH-FMN oxidoreductase RutF
MAPHDNLSLDYIRSLRKVASTVVMVTSYVGSRPWGLTVSAFCSVSVEPPLCLVSVGTTTATYKSVAEHGTFGVSILSTRHLETARYGSAPGLPKFLERFCSERTSNRESEVYLGASGSGPLSDRVGVSQTPEVPGAVAHYHCSVESSRIVADHAILIGRVREVVHGPAAHADPLLYWQGAFHELGNPIADGLTSQGKSPSAAREGHG